MFVSLYDSALDVIGMVGGEARDMLAEAAIVDAMERTAAAGEFDTTIAPPDWSGDVQPSPAVLAWWFNLLRVCAQSAERYFAETLSGDEITTDIIAERTVVEVLIALDGPDFVRVMRTVSRSIPST